MRLTQILKYLNKQRRVVLNTTSIKISLLNNYNPLPYSLRKYVRTNYRMFTNLKFTAYQITGKNLTVHIFRWKGYISCQER